MSPFGVLQSLITEWLGVEKQKGHKLMSSSPGVKDHAWKKYYGCKYPPCWFFGREIRQYKMDDYAQRQDV